MSLDSIKKNIITINITEDMVAEAKREENERMEKYGHGTREVTNKDGVIVRRDLIGSLAHQAVDILFEQCNVPFESFRDVRYKKGDITDIKYEDDYIDVKGTMRDMNNKYSMYQNFLVFQKQLDDKKMDKITHFCFVVVDENLRQAHIFGIISVSDFLRKAESVKLQYENKGIAPSELTNMRNYIFRTGGSR